MGEANSGTKKVLVEKNQGERERDIRLKCTRPVGDSGHPKELFGEDGR